MDVWLLLWVSWIFLLSTSSVVFSRPKGSNYRLKAPTKNFGGDVEKKLPALSFDEGELDSSDNQPTGHEYKPEIMEPLNLPPSGEHAPSASDVEPFDPNTFHLNFGNNVVVTQYEPAAVQHGASTPGLSTGANSASPSFSEVSGYAGQMAAYKPVPSTSWAVSSGSSEFSKPGNGIGTDGMAVLGFGSVHPNFISGSSPAHPNFISGSSPAQSGTNHLAGKESHHPWVNAIPSWNYAGRYGQSNDVGEPLTWYAPQMFSGKYPSVNTKPAQTYSANAAKQYSQGNVGAGASTWYTVPPKKHFFQSVAGPQPSSNNWVDLPDIDDWNFPFDQMDQMHNMVTSVQKFGIPQQDNRPRNPHPKRLVQSKSGYRRGKVLLSKASYSPEYVVTQKAGWNLNPFKRLA